MVHILYEEWVCVGVGAVGDGFKLQMRLRAPPAPFPPSSFSSSPHPSLASHLARAEVQSRTRSAAGVPRGGRRSSALFLAISSPLLHRRLYVSPSLKPKFEGRFFVLRQEKEGKKQGHFPPRLLWRQLFLVGCIAFTVCWEIFQNVLEQAVLSF